MLAIAALGSVVLARRRMAAVNLLPLVALAAGALIGAFFHLIPAALDELPVVRSGCRGCRINTFFALEQVLLASRAYACGW
jgi:hypothetical protein